MVNPVDLVRPVDEEPGLKFLQVKRLGHMGIAREMNLNGRRALIS